MDGPDGVAVSAEGLGLRGPRGWVFRGVGIDAPPGSLIALEGPSGSGRTSLLLTLTGRMRPREGRATVGSHHLPKQMAAVRRISGLAHVPGVSELDPALTVGEHLRERTLLERRFTGSPRGLLRPRGERAATARQRIETALSAAGLVPDALPKGARTAVRDLERLEALRLSVALALIGRPRLLAVDDTDLKLSAAERAEAWELLNSLAEGGTTVVTVCSEAPEGAVVVSTAPAQDAPALSAAPAQDTPEEGENESENDGNDSENDGAEGADSAAAEDAGGGADSENDSEDNDKETADALAETGRA
ncbi:ATP-binding cassette domain-containing protein [Streptomyces cavernae]|uniref:ATP-binding cassette domain-containing protein n=1 Tax=Streptomyces cavernae TaxID=2259034 RepID=UPI000FEBDD7E|nr:ATP-binding cassette domain-containing protein [Streptomyces cavernae]